MYKSLRKCRKCVAFLICASHFLQFKKLLIENNTEYNFYILKSLRFKRHPKNQKTRSLRKLLDIRYMYMDEVEEIDIARWCFCYGI